MDDRTPFAERPPASHAGESRSVTPLDFWFDFGSNYSYLSVMRIELLARQAGVPIRWRPFLLGPIFKHLGWDAVPWVAQKEKGAYVWKDMVRQCRKYGLPWKMPETFPRAAVLPLRVALLGAQRPWMAEYCRRTMQRNFVEDRDIDSVGAVAEVLSAMKLPAAEIIEAAQSNDNKLALRRQTDEALARGIFGAPTFFAGDEMFWGNDRLEDALACCRASAVCRS